MIQFLWESRAINDPMPSLSLDGGKKKEKAKRKWDRNQNERERKREKGEEGKERKGEERGRKITAVVAVRLSSPPPRKILHQIPPRKILRWGTHRQIQRDL